MKRVILVLVALIVTFTLTGCGNKDDDKITAIPEDNQGLYQGPKYSIQASSSLINYYVFKVEANTIMRKLCMIGSASGVKSTIEDCDFDDGNTGIYETKSFDVKDFELLVSTGNVSFNMYDGSEIYAKCKTSFGSIYCTRNDGSSLSLSKKK